MTIANTYYDNICYYKYIIFQFLLYAAIQFATKFAATLVGFRGSRVRIVAFWFNIPFPQVDIGIFWNNLVYNVIAEYIGQLEI